MGSKKKTAALDDIILNCLWNLLLMFDVLQSGKTRPYSTMKVRDVGQPTAVTHPQVLVFSLSMIIFFSGKVLKDFLTASDF